MPLKAVGVIDIPDSTGTLFDHGAFEPSSRRVFVAHTARDRVEVIDHDTSRHLTTLHGFPEAAGVVADDGQVLITNRGAAGLAWIDAHTLETRAVLDTGVRPNGVAIVSRRKLAVVACIGDKTYGPVLQVLHLENHKRWAIDLPGQPRWCVTDVIGTRVFVAIRDPSMVLVARLPELEEVQHWKLPSTGAHGIDIDHLANRLYIACDGGALVELETLAGEAHGEWPLSGVPDATFFNAASGLVHVAIGKPGLVESINPRTGECTQCTTAAGAKTTALNSPAQLLCVFAEPPRSLGSRGMVVNLSQAPHQQGGAPGLMALPLPTLMPQFRLSFELDYNREVKRQLSRNASHPPASSAPAGSARRRRGRRWPDWRRK